MVYFAYMNEYDNWNILKIHIESNLRQSYFFIEREVWWCSIGFNIGEEENGKNTLFERPVLILKKFNSRICLIFPLSSKIKQGIFYRTIYYNGRSQSVLLSQIKLISAKRLIRRIGKIDLETFNVLKISFWNMINS